MKRIINFIKKDFADVKTWWGYKLGRSVRLWIFIPYYVIMLLIMTPVLPFIWLYCIIKIKLILWSLKKEA